MEALEDGGGLSSDDKPSVSTGMAVFDESLEVAAAVGKETTRVVVVSVVVVVASGDGGWRSVSATGGLGGEVGGREFLRRLYLRLSNHTHYVHLQPNKPTTLCKVYHLC